MMRGMRVRGNYGNRFLSHFIVDYDSFGIFVLIFNEIDMEAAKRYFLFADECGDQNLSKYDPNFPVFTLCGIIVTRDQVRNLEREIKALKQKIWHTEDVILHSHEIRRCKNYFKVLQDVAVKQEFYSELDRILGENQAYIIVSCSVLKDDYTRTYGKLSDIYSQSLTFLLERAVFYVDDLNPGIGGKIDAMLEKRGKEEDKTLSEAYNALRETGTFWVDSERMKNHFDRLTFVPKSANIVGLQIADLVAYPIACHILRPEAPNLAFEIIQKNIYSSDGKLLGLKIIK